MAGKLLGNTKKVEGSTETTTEKCQKVCEEEREIETAW